MEPAGTNLASYELVTGRRAASGSAEAAMVRVEPDGTVRAAIGNPASGQGYETVIAQIIADELGVAPTRVQVERGFDSATTPWLYLSGNYANKFSVTDVGAVVGAARAVREKLLKIAAHRLEGRRKTRATRGRRACGASRAAHCRSPSWPGPRTPTSSGSRRAGTGAGSPPRASESRGPAGRRPAPGALLLVFSNAAHLCLVEIHPRTGLVRVLKHVVVHDCGRELNPMIVEGMVHGSTVHGLGAALLEEFRTTSTGSS